MQLLKTKDTLIIALLLAFSVTFQNDLNAQKIKTTNFDFDFQTAPEEPLPAYLKTYFIEIKGDYKDNEEKKKLILEKVKLDNRQLVTEREKADLIIELTIPKLAFVKKEKKKLKSGSGEDATTEYWYDYHYNMPVKIKIIFVKYKYKYFNSDIMRTTLIRSGTKSNNPDTYKTSDLGQDVIEKICFSHANSRLGKFFHKYYKKNKISYEMTLTAPKFKNNNDEALKLAVEKTKEMFKSFSKKNFIERELNEPEMLQMKKHINLWETTANELDLSSGKPEVKKNVLNGLKLNLVFAYILVHDFKKAWTLLNEYDKHKKQLKNHKRAQSSLSKFLISYQTKYVFNHKEYDITDIIEGKWKVMAVITDKKYDLNGDGKVSNDMLKERNICKVYAEYDYLASKKMIINRGKADKGCKVTVEDDLFWTVTRSKIDDRWYLVTGYDENFNPNDGKPLLIKTIAYNRIVLYTRMYINDDIGMGEIHLLPMKGN